MRKKQNGKEKYLGEFEITVLAAILRLGDEAYGVSIIDEIESRAGRSVSIGALYATLKRLESKHYIASHMGEVTAERGGRAKRYVKLTAEGRTQLDKSLRVLHNMIDGLNVWPPKIGAEGATP